MSLAAYLASLIGGLALFGGCVAALAWWAGTAYGKARAGSALIADKQRLHEENVAREAEVVTLRARVDELLDQLTHDAIVVNWAIELGEDGVR